MSIDFFNNACKEPARTDEAFGICDDEGKTKAYTNIDDNTKWVATVRNEGEKEIIFIAIDNCTIVFDEDTAKQESTCDGMLVFDSGLYLVELKNQGKRWLSEKAMKQLKNTIKLLGHYNDLSEFRYRKAYACNKRHPRFTVIDNEVSKRFFKETGGFRIDAQAEIIIK